MKIQRRRVLQAGAIVGIAGPMQGLLTQQAAADGKAAESKRRAKPRKKRGDGGGYGPLVDVKDLRDGEVRLQLPKGFKYRSFGEVGSPMKDGNPTPSRHDGMASFGGGGYMRLVRNHEVRDSGPAIGDPALAYDPLATGGTTTVRVNEHAAKERSWVSLGGTLFNCAGGSTGWHSWITCEETVNGPDVGPDFRGVGGPPGDPDTFPNPLMKPHGYIFEVPAKANHQVKAVPIKAAGRFAHEACAFDYKTNALYMTEDNFAFPSGLYRYLPPNKPWKDKYIADGGKLQMLRVVGHDCLELAFGQQQGMTWKVDWVDIAEPDPTFVGFPDNDTAIQAVGLQGFDKGGAKFSRLEGMTKAGRVLYFNSTQGGPVAADETPETAESGYGDGRGQVFALDLKSMKLHLLYQSPAISTLDLPDNITVSPRGTLVLCEDNTPDNYIRGLTRYGKIFDFCKNVIVGGDEEFAGVTFSPEGKTMFVNIQGRVGLSFAIWGPWQKGPL